jgi:hypothetical protein
MMTMSKRVKIGDHDFPTKKATYAHNSAVLARGHALYVEENSKSFCSKPRRIREDVEYVKALLKFHPDYEEITRERKLRKGYAFCVAPKDAGGKEVHGFFIMCRTPGPMIPWRSGPCIEAAAKAAAEEETDGA